MIIINARFLTQPITGVQRFAIEICKELKKSNISIEFVSPRNIIHKELKEELGVKRLGFLKGHLWEQITLQFYVFKKNATLISFCNTAPIFIKKQIVTIHDLGFRVHPEWASKPFVFIYNIIVPLIAKNSKHIITVSNTSKEEIIRELNIPSQKITVVYNAVSSVFTESYLPLSKQDENLLKKDYILAVSSHHPRKNFKRLVEAFLKMKDSGLSLYIIGNTNKHFSDYNITNPENDKIIFLTNISDEQLTLFYQNTRLFVYPSLYEGFGIPIIEAVSQGASVCVSDIPVFREICGNNVIYFDPEDILDIKNKICETLNTKSNTQFDLTKYSWKSSSMQVEALILEMI